MLLKTVIIFVLITVSGTSSKNIKFLPLAKASIAGLHAYEKEFKFHVQISHNLQQGLSTCIMGGSIISQRYTLTKAETYVLRR